MFERARGDIRPTRTYRERAVYALAVALTACSFPDPSFVDEGGASGAGGSGASSGTASNGGSSTSGTSNGGGASTVPTVLAANQGDVRTLAADTDTVFWVSATGMASTGDLRSVASTGGKVQTVLSDEALARAQAMALDSGTVFIALDRNLYGVPRAAPTLEPVFDPTDVSVLLLGAADMYMGAPWGVSRLSKLGPIGGNLIVLGGEGARLLALDGETALILDPPADGDNIHAVPGDGTTALAQSPVVLSGAASVTGLAFDADSYFWTRATQGTVEQQDRSGGPTKTLAQGESLPNQIAVTSSAIYWITDSGHALRRLPKGGKAVTTLGSARPDLLAQIGDFVAWVAQNGDVMAVHD